MFLQVFAVLALAATSVNAWSPTNSYAPGKISCPNGTLIREANGLSNDETEWLKQRHNVTDPNLVDFLTRANMQDFDAADFINSQTKQSINVALAFSGGGYRAMLNGGGQLSALDNRTNSAAETGLGGLLQASSYLAGLSGGSWLVGTLVMNNWTDAETILAEGKIWDLENSILTPGGINIFETVDIWDSIDDDVDDKKNAGFNTSLTDAWGRSLSRQFFSYMGDTGAAICWSDLRSYDAFTSHQMPFPLIVSDGRAPGTVIINQNSTVFELSPFELGSWDPAVRSFSDVKYLGTKVKNGTPEGSCIAGYDNAGFVIGSSSTLFNQFLLQLSSTGLPSWLISVIELFLSVFAGRDDDIAIYSPNPKTNYANTVSLTSSYSLFLVDGGEDGQNIPLVPLIRPERQVDVIMAFDNSADTDTNWPDGSSLVASYERQFGSQGDGISFPYVPDINTFINRNLTAKPTFFGCNASNLTTLIGEDDFVPPLIIYMANRPFSYWSNTSTFQLSYSDSQKSGLVQNGFDVASRLELSLDPEWPACVGCAIIRRKQEAIGLEQSEQCQKCFQEYCWDGKYDSDGVFPTNFTLQGM